jgi:transposase
MADGTSAADFVRGLPSEMTLREMDAAQKTAGHSLSHQRVYQIRHDEKLGFKRASPGVRHGKKKKKKPPSVKRVTAQEAIAAIPKKPSYDAKAQLRRLALQVGLERVEQYVRELKREAGIDE